MTQIFATAIESSVVVLEANVPAFTFIEDLEYEFVGGGTAVNSD